MNKAYFFSIAIFSVFFFGNAYAEDSDFQQRFKLAEEIVELTQADQLMDQLSEGMLAGQAQAFEVLFAKTPLSERQREEIIEETLEVISEELEPALAIFAEKQAPLLADVYTYEELEGILSFYKSQAGQAMLSKQNELLEKSMLIGQEWNTENLPQVLERIKPRIEKIVENAIRGI